MSLNITAIPAFEDNYIWTLYHEDSEQIICVDPGEARPVIEFCEANHKTLAAILVTHKHPDHIGGIPELMNKFPEVKVYAPEKTYLHYAHFQLQEQAHFSILGLDFEFWETPGHTIDHGIYWLKESRDVFIGDTVFSLGCGRVFDGSLETLHQSLQRIKNRLQLELWKIYPTHEYTLSNLNFLEAITGPSSITEKIKADILANWNPVTGSLPTNSQRELAGNPFFETDFESFKALRLARNQWKGMMKK